VTNRANLVPRPIVASADAHQPESSSDFDPHIDKPPQSFSRFKGRMRVFRGVATKNLAHYLGWVRLFDRLPEGGAERFLLDAIGVKS
jgi:hypothetical protein